MIAHYTLENAAILEAEANVITDRAARFLSIPGPHLGHTWALVGRISGSRLGLHLARLWFMNFSLDAI